MMTDRLPSVTTVLGVLSKEGLSWAAAKTTAEYAIDHADELERYADRAERVRKLYTWHKGVWEARAAFGTCLHHVNEAWAKGETVDLGDLIERQRPDTRIWDDRPTVDIAAELSVMVDGLEAAWKDLDPETISVEDVVRWPHPTLGYIGTSDWRLKLRRSGGKRWLVDLKTTAQLDPRKAFYWSDWRLQLAAYGACTERVHYDTPGIRRPYAKGVTETGTSPLEPVDGHAILHVRANGKWAWLPVDAGKAEHEVFVELRRLWGWLNGPGKKPGEAA